MTAPDIQIQPGIPDPLRPKAGELLFEAFEGKLGGFLGRDGRGARLMARFMRPAETLSALSPDGTTLYGLAGLKTGGRPFMDGTLSDIAGEYGVFGGLYLAAPTLMTRPLGIEPISASGFTDLRATYGGFQLAMAGFLIWCLRDADRVATGLVAFAFLVGGLAVCRSIGLLVDGMTAPMLAATVFEVGLTGFTLFVRARIATA